MKENEITLLLYGETPFEQVVNTLSKSKCLSVLEYLKASEKMVETSNYGLWGRAFGMTEIELRNTKLSEIRKLITLVEERLSYLG